MGERLAAEAPVEADVVIPVPDSGTPAAVGFAQASGIPFGEGLVKNRYVGRTFIQPDQALRERGVKLKFNVLRSVLAGQAGGGRRRLDRPRLDHPQAGRDAVRGGRPEVHLRISSPPIISPCFYGIDMADQDQLIAAGRNDRAGARRAGRDLARLPRRWTGCRRRPARPADRFCRACLTGEYPTEIPDEMRLSKLRFEQLPRRRPPGERRSR